MFLLQFLVSLPLYVILAAVSILAATFSIFMKRSARKSAKKVDRFATKGRKKLVRANANTAKKRWKARKSAGNGRVQTSARAKGVSPSRKPKQIASAPVRSGGKCGSTKTISGKACRNPRVPGKDHCHLHPSGVLVG